MTDAEFRELGELCSRQFGGPPERYIETFTDSSGKFRPVMLAQACEVVMGLAMDDDCPARVTGRFLVRAILTKCLGTPITNRRREAPVYPDCEHCGKTGFVTVPHPRDWVMGGEFWNGEFTCAVACDCEAGGLQRINHRSLSSYEREFTNWREEYPLRQLERRVALGMRGAEHELRKFFKAQDERQSNVSQAEASASESSGCSDPAQESGCPQDQEGDGDPPFSEGGTLVGVGSVDEGTPFEGS